LKNKVEIRSTSDIESDDFNDLIVIERKIKELFEDGIISEEELQLIEYVEDGKPLVDSKEAIGKNRISAAKDFNRLCDKIAFYVGGYFTNDGYIDYMKTKHNLNDEQVGRMIDYMKSRYKNKLMRKSNKTNE
jgi:hypothetical protein